jgi:uncharacterized integral membrane protein
MTTEPRRGSIWDGLSRILAFVLGALVVLFAVVNSAQVHVNFLAFAVDVPLFVLIIGVVIVGFLAGLLSRGRAA